MTWYVEVVEYGSNEVIHKIECKSESRADRVDDGMQHNLDHERFYTRVVERQKKGGKSS